MELTALSTRGLEMPGQGRLSVAGPTGSHGMSYRTPLSDSEHQCLLTWRGMQYHSHFTNEVTEAQLLVQDHLENMQHQNLHPTWGPQLWVHSIMHGGLWLLAWPLMRLCLHLHCHQWYFSVVWAAVLFHYLHYWLLQRGVTLPASGEF